MKKTLLIADDHALVRETIATYLESTGEFEVFQAESLDETIFQISKTTNFDAILLDFSMPGMKALEGFRKVMKLCPHAPVALLSGTVPISAVNQSLAEGAAGFLPKTLTPQELILAVKKMLEGEVFTPPTETWQAEVPLQPVLLTPREKDVLRGLADGKSNKEIARELGVQEVTIKLHVKTLSRKLDARNRTHAAMLGRDLFLL
jgi:two-component system nitrate/nitrite response regulator NarL